MTKRLKSLLFYTFLLLMLLVLLFYSLIRAKGYHYAPVVEPNVFSVNYLDEDGTIVIGRENTEITSELFELDDGTTLAEASGGCIRSRIGD